jgi:hypothetical protein
MRLRLAALLVFASLLSAQTKSTTKPKTAPKAASKATSKKAAPAKTAAIQTEDGRTLPPPKEEASHDKTLVAFLAHVKDVAKRKDRNGLVAMLAPDVSPGPRGEPGPSAFFNAWELGDPDSSVYPLLTQILSLTGVWVGEQYCAPYVGVLFPAELDAWKHHVVLNPDVKLRETAAANGKVLANLKYNIVEVLDRKPDWTKVKTESGLVGFVPAGYTYSPAAYRACFAKNASGEWKIQSLASGPNH